VTARHENGEIPVSSEKLLAWKNWALAQAEKLDPVGSGRFADSPEDGDLTENT